MCIRDRPYTLSETNAEPLLPHQTVAIIGQHENKEYQDSQNVIKNIHKSASFLFPAAILNLIKMRVQPILGHQLIVRS